MQGMFDMATDSGLFRTRAELEAADWKLTGNHFALGSQRVLPLVEAKMVHHYDHRFCTYENGQTQAQANKGTLPGSTTRRTGSLIGFTSCPNTGYPSMKSRRDSRSNGIGGWLLGWRDICAQR